jgi:hypothetical protein
MKMLAIVLATAFMSSTAYGQIYYQQPTYCPPVVTSPVVVLPADHNYVHFNGAVYSKVYVRVQTPDGIVEVPVINGILPRFNRTKQANGSVIRHFYYDTNSRWKNDGRMPVYEDESKKPTPAPRTTPVPPRTIPAPRTTPVPPRTIPAPRTTPTPRLEFKELPGLEELRRDNNALKKSNETLQKKLDDLGGEVERLKNQPVQPVPPPSTERKELPLFNELQKLEKSVTELKGDLEVIRTLNDKKDQEKVKQWEKNLMELRGEIEKLQQKDQETPSDLPPIIDPKDAIPRNPAPMIRPSEIK